MDIEIDGRYLRHANPTSERISDNARRRARNNRRVIQIEDAPPARLLMRFTYEAPWRKTPFHPFRFRRFLYGSPLLSLSPSLPPPPAPPSLFLRRRNFCRKDTLPKSTICRERTVVKSRAEGCARGVCQRDVFAYPFLQRNIWNCPLICFVYITDKRESKRYIYFFYITYILAR